jgi:hypothetical protein
MVRIAITMLAAVAGAATGPLAHAQPTGGPGSIKGTVIFEGEAPERARLRRDTDPQCAKREAFSEDVIVNSGKLKDVLVRIKNGSLPAPKAVPPPAVIDQKDCTYAPHVVGLVVGQKLALRTSDPTFHNVHGSIAGKDAWNKPSAPGDPELIVAGSARAGDVIDIKCDIHRWMRAYAVVQDHTAFAVTDDVRRVRDHRPAAGQLHARGLAPDARHAHPRDQDRRRRQGRGDRADLVQAQRPEGAMNSRARPGVI